MNSILHRPYYRTFELSNDGPKGGETQIRVVSAEEIHQDALAGVDDDLADESTELEGDGYVNAGEDGNVEMKMKNNQETVDDTSRQALTMDEIEELKQGCSGSGKEIVAKIMASHTALTEKTAYSLAKYILRKSKKFVRRFTVLPLNVSNLLHCITMEKESQKILELREEMLGLIASWSNIRYAAPLDEPEQNAEKERTLGVGRWLVVDDTSGLVLASLAERLGLLYQRRLDEDIRDTRSDNQENGLRKENPEINNLSDTKIEDSHENANTAPKNDSNPITSSQPSKAKIHHTPGMSARNNTITLIHSTSQPNISLLRYFGYDSNNPSTSHPLYTHLKSLSWLQLLHPDEDPLYQEPETVRDEVIHSWKGGKRSNYYKKWRRWERVKRVTDETRAGRFDGLVVASTMEPASILRHTVPLLHGGAQVVVYSPLVEPLAELVDFYSKARKMAYMQELARCKSEKLPEDTIPEDDFPVDPTALLAPRLQTARARAWQVLPGRTHPVMTSRGGAEGYLFTATKVLPAEGPIQGRGSYAKKRKVDREPAA